MTKRNLKIAITPESWAYCVDEAINILKGDQS